MEKINALIKRLSIFPEKYGRILPFGMIDLKKEASQEIEQLLEFIKVNKELENVSFHKFDLSSLSTDMVCNILKAIKLNKNIKNVDFSYSKVSALDGELLDSILDLAKTEHITKMEMSNNNFDDYIEKNKKFIKGLSQAPLNYLNLSNSSLESFGELCLKTIAFNFKNNKSLVDLNLSDTFSCDDFDCNAEIVTSLCSSATIQKLNIEGVMGATEDYNDLQNIFSTLAKNKVLKSLNIETYFLLYPNMYSNNKKNILVDLFVNYLEKCNLTEIQFAHTVEYNQQMGAARLLVAAQNNGNIKVLNIHRSTKKDLIQKLLDSQQKILPLHDSVRNKFIAHDSKSRQNNVNKKHKRFTIV